MYTTHLLLHVCFLQPALMTEVDGAVAGDFFTVLCVGQSYTEDQWMNMYTFSMIKSWLLTYDTDGSSTTESGNEINWNVLMCVGWYCIFGGGACFFCLIASQLQFPVSLMTCRNNSGLDFYFC